MKIQRDHFPTHVSCLKKSVPDNIIKCHYLAAVFKIKIMKKISYFIITVKSYWNYFKR